MVDTEGKMANNTNMNRLTDLSAHFKERKARATERLSTNPPNGSWHFAILGLSTNVERFEIEGIAILQRVIEPPGEIELAGALENKNDFGAIARYSHNIQFELAVQGLKPYDEQHIFTRAWWIISALRVRTSSEFLVPVAANMSWSVIAAINDGSCRSRFIEDIPLAKRFHSIAMVTKEDLEWVEANLVKFVELLEVPKFRLAVESLTTHNFQHSERMTAATLWSGIEALFEIQSELRFRLAVVIATILEERGTSQKDLYRKIKKLYDTRSKAVHGSPLSKSKMDDHIIETRTLLSKLLCKFVELGGIPSEDDIENFMFT